MTQDQPKNVKDMTPAEFAAARRKLDADAFAEHRETANANDLAAMARRFGRPKGQ